MGASSEKVSASPSMSVAASEPVTVASSFAALVVACATGPSLVPVTVMVNVAPSAPPLPSDTV